MATKTQYQSPTGRGVAFKGTEGIFLLPHHPNELERVNAQHSMILNEIGDNIVKAPLEQNSSLRVLDSGCTDGAWLVDLDKVFPGHRWSLHGIDNHDAFFPSKDQASASLDLRKHDIHDAFPSSWGWDNSFDLVHQRLLILGVKTKDWPQVTKNLVGAAKPGGWIQLSEMIWLDDEIWAELNKHPLLAKQGRFQDWVCYNHDFDCHVAQKLEGLLKDAGCKNIQKFDYKIGFGAAAKGEKWKELSTDTWVEVFRHFEHIMPHGGIPGVAQTPQEMHDFLDALRGEIETTGYTPKLRIVVGQKP